MFRSNFCALTKSTILTTTVSLLLVFNTCNLAEAQEQDVVDRSGKESLAQFIFEMMNRHDAKRGFDVWEQHKQSTKFYVDSSELFNAAFTLHRQEKPKEAIELLKRIRREFEKAKRSFVLNYSIEAFANGTDSAAKWLTANGNADDWAYSEFELNVAGSAFFDAGRVKEAKALAEIFVTKFPKAKDSHERQAEVFLAEGKSDLALKHYRKRLALESNQTSFFHLAVEPATKYSPTIIPDDVTKLFHAEGDANSNIVFLFVQGGPCPYFGVYRTNPLSLLPNPEKTLRVQVTESQILNPGMLAASPPLTEKQALFEHQQSAEILHRVVKHFKDQDKKVVVVGHSYGCHIGIEYLHSKQNLADRLILMGSDLDEDLRNYPEDLVGTGRIVRWVDGVEPFEREFFGDFGLKPLLNENLKRIFQNTGALVSFHGKRRFTELLKGKDLSNVIFMYGKFDESNGRSKPYELQFWREHGAKTVESYGDHHSMLSQAHMRNLYEHVFNDAPLRQSVASFLADKTDELGSAKNAIELFQANKDNGKFHELVEQEINTLGYQLVAQSKIKEAISVFGLNASSFPDSWNAHDSLGEAYLTAGELDRAVASYTKSLDIHPGNTFGIAALERIEALQQKSNKKDLSSEPALAKGVSDAVQKCMTDQNLPGVAVVIVKDGKTVFKRGYGLANVETGQEVDPDTTVFRIGSISKALTLLTLARLIDDGRVGLDDDVSKYIEGINNSRNYKTPVTIKHLLTHTGGFDQIGGRDRQIHEFNLGLAERKAKRPSLRDYLQGNRLRRVSEAGEYFRYDTYGSTLAGAIIEQVTGLDYAEAMQQEMFSVLGMQSSFVEVSPMHFNRLATGYGYVGSQFVPQPYEVFVTTPASSIDATPADMGRLLQALTVEGANESGRFFSKKQANATLAPQFRSHPEFVGITHGMFESYTSRADDFKKHVRTVGHGGSMRGFIASMTVVPKHGLGVFVVTNRDPEAGGGRVDLLAIQNTVIANLTDLPDRRAHQVPEKNASADLSEFAGDYYYGVFCHSSTAEDRAQGAWQRGRPRTVVAKKGALLVGDEEYLPRGEDVFVRLDGRKLVYFGRNSGGKVSHFVYSSSADTFEKAKE